MVAHGSTVGAELGCGIVAAKNGHGGWGWSLPWSTAKLVTALLAFHLGKRMEYVAGTLTEGNPGCLGCGDLHAEFQSVAPPKVICVRQRKPHSEHISCLRNSHSRFRNFIPKSFGAPTSLVLKTERQQCAPKASQGLSLGGARRLLVIYPQSHRRRLSNSATVCT